MATLSITSTLGGQSIMESEPRARMYRRIYVRARCSCVCLCYVCTGESTGLHMCRCAARFGRVRAWARPESGLKTLPSYSPLTPFA